MTQSERRELVKEHDTLTDQISEVRQRLLRMQLKQVALQRQIASTPKQ